MNSVFPVNIIVRNKPTVQNKHLSAIKSQDLSPSNPVHVREKPVEWHTAKQAKYIHYIIWHDPWFSLLVLFYVVFLKDVADTSNVLSVKHLNKEERKKNSKKTFLCLWWQTFLQQCQYNNFWRTSGHRFTSNFLWQCFWACKFVLISICFLNELFFVIKKKV